MGEITSYTAYERRRALRVVIVLTIAGTLGVLTLPSGPVDTPTAAELHGRLRLIGFGLVLMLCIAAAWLWRIASKESELLVTMPPEGPDPYRWYAWRYVPRRDRPVFYRTASAAIAICAAALLYLSWRIDALLSR